MGHTYPIIVNNAIVENNILGFAVASRTGGNMWGGFGIANLNDDRGYILYSTFFDLTNFDTLSWTKSGSVSQQMWLQNESGQNVATLIDYTNHTNTNATPFNCSNLSGMYRFALYTNTNSSGSSSWSASVRLDSLYVSDNRWYVDAYSNPSNTSTFSGLGSYTDNADVSLQSNPIGGYGFVNWKLKGYTRLEYIESSGTQYIDTKYIIPVGTPSSRVKVKLLNKVVDGTYHTYRLGGAYGSANTNRAMIMYFCSSDGRLGIGQSDAQIYYNFSANTIYEVDLKAQSGTIQGTINGQTISSTYNGQIGSTRNYYLFAHNENGSVGMYSKSRIYYFQLWDNDVLVRDYVPCLRHSDGAIGLLDLVELKFYGNSGSGEFYGAFHYEPTEFDTLEYIESSGTFIGGNVI